MPYLGYKHDDKAHVLLLGGEAGDQGADRLGEVRHLLTPDRRDAHHYRRCNHTISVITNDVISSIDLSLSSLSLIANVNC